MQEKPNDPKIKELKAAQNHVTTSHRRYFLGYDIKRRVLELNTDHQFEIMITIIRTNREVADHNKKRYAPFVRTTTISDMDHESSNKKNIISITKDHSTSTHILLQSNG